jgi:hypothetical protein
MFTADNAHVPELRELNNRQAWYAADVQGRPEWIHHLEPADCDELRDALGVARQSGLPLPLIDRRAFPLRRLASKLAGLKDEALRGRGFCLLRGLPVETFDAWESTAAFWGMGLYLGEAVSQNGKGHVLGHVANLGLDYADPEVRGYQTTSLLNYHTDASDLVLLLCLRTPQQGGHSYIASSTTVWNEAVRRRPDLARILTEPFYYTRWGEVGAGMSPFYGMPIFQQCEGRIVASYVQSAIRKAQRLPGVPPLTAAQEEALALLDSLTADPAIHLGMEFQRGDIQVLCNHFTLHSRTSYLDWPESERRRHLLRLWLACEDGPALPSNYTELAQGRTASGRPNGINVPGVPLSAPLAPC